MHDELLERRLRTALHEEADRLPFTITAAELERRAALRGRGLGAGNRRVALLLAAAVGIGVVGIGAVLTGLVEGPVDPRPSVPPTNVVVAPTGPPESPGPAVLPSLDELVAGAAGTVVIAQSHDAAGLPGLPPETDIPAPSVGLGVLDALGTYVLSAACLDGGDLRFDARFPLSRGPIDGPVVPCDGRVHDSSLEVRQARALSFTADAGSSWRLVVRGPNPEETVVTPFPLLQAELGSAELVRMDEWAPDGSAAPWGASGKVIQEIGGVSSRLSYRVQAWCEAGDEIGVVFGDMVDAERFVATETRLGCDGGVHGFDLGIPEPAGSRVYLAARPGARVQLLITGEQPPIDAQLEQPGWVPSTWFGPDLAIEQEEHNFTGIGADNGGPALVAFACAGTEDIVVSVDVGEREGEDIETFTATCTPDGAVSSQSFDFPTSVVSVSYTSPPLTWTAVGILIEDPTTR